MPRISVSLKRKYVIRDGMLATISKPTIVGKDVFAEAVVMGTWFQGVLEGGYTPMVEHEGFVYMKNLLGEPHRIVKELKGPMKASI